MFFVFIKKKQYFLDVRVLGGNFMNKGYLINSLPWMDARTSVREAFNGEARALIEIL